MSALDGERRIRAARGSSSAASASASLGRAVVVDRDVGAGLVQRARDDGADAFRGARDERPAAVESGLSCGTGHRSLQTSVFLCARLHYRHAHDSFDDESARSCPSRATTRCSSSAALVAEIRREIERAGGWIDFARYMELALYAPGLGYYSAGSTKLGAAGDFVTAPELSPIVRARAGD